MTWKIVEMHEMPICDICYASYLDGDRAFYREMDGDVLVAEGLTVCEKCMRDER